jgi:hypothetical protein
MLVTTTPRQQQNNDYQGNEDSSVFNKRIAHNCINAKKILQTYTLFFTFQSRNRKNKVVGGGKDELPSHLLKNSKILKLTVGGGKDEMPSHL